MSLDHAGNALRLGIVTDIHHEHLDDGEPRKSAADKRAEKSEPLPVLCDCCKAVLPRQAKVCDQCGCTREAKSGIVHRDGELVELGSRRKGRPAAPTFGEKVQFYAELRGHAGVKGFKPGWAQHKFKERFGIWPDGYALAPPEPPSLKTRNWIRSRQIAFMKGRAHG